jgi:catechol 2,3-dioxygenase-like lactoylglutathione lyase family enzyme
VRQDTAKRMDLVAFAAESAQAVDDLGARLGTADVKIDREPGTLDTPGGGYGMRFFDPDGRLVEVSANVEAREFRNLEPRESVPQKLSHVVFNSTDVVATKAFYETHLGFKLSDSLEDMMCFMRTRVDHHILAISKGPHTSLNHVSFEMRGTDEYMRGSGRLILAGNKPLWGPGRHGAGDNTSTYFLDPNGNVVEYTTELGEDRGRGDLGTAPLRGDPGGGRPVGHRRAHHRGDDPGDVQRSRQGAVEHLAGVTVRATDPRSRFSDPKGPSLATTPIPARRWNPP